MNKVLGETNDKDQLNVIKSDGIMISSQSKMMIKVIPIERIRRGVITDETMKDLLQTITKERIEA